MYVKITHTNTYIDTYMHTYIHTYIHTGMAPCRRSKIEPHAACLSKALDRPYKEASRQSSQTNSTYKYAFMNECACSCTPYVCEYIFCFHCPLHMDIHIPTCISGSHMHPNTCTYTQMYIHTHAHTHTYTYTHPCRHPSGSHMHPSKCTYIHTSLQTSIRVTYASKHIHMYIHTSLQASIRVTYASKHMYIHAHILADINPGHIYIKAHTHVHTHILADIHQSLIYIHGFWLRKKSTVPQRSGICRVRLCILPDRQQCQATATTHDTCVCSSNRRNVQQQTHR